VSDVSDNLLADLEVIAVDVDRLAATASDDDTRGRLSARRQRLLIELDVVGVFDPGGELRGRVAKLGLEKLVGYCDAAAALWMYYASSTRDRLVDAPRPARLVDGAFSLDWFRVPSGYMPAGVDPHEWLAQCELAFTSPKPTGGGNRWTRLHGRMHVMSFRGEITNEPKLVRVVPD
jgi:hypothetical protein